MKFCTHFMLIFCLILIERQIENTFDWLIFMAQSKWKSSAKSIDTQKWSQMGYLSVFPTSEDEVAFQTFEMSADKTFNTQTSITPMWIQHPTYAQNTQKNQQPFCRSMDAILYEWNIRNVKKLTFYDILCIHIYVENYYHVFISTYKIIITFENTISTKTCPII